MPFEHWNIALFHLINAPAGTPDWAVQSAVILASWPIGVSIALVSGLWIWGVRKGRAALVASGAGLLVALAIAMLIAGLNYYPRPFEMGLGQSLMPHVPETSFPSDHAVFMWGIGFSLIATSTWWRWGVVISALGLGVGWARVFLGVHFPFDVTGAALIACFGAGSARLLMPLLDNTVRPVIERVYEALLRTLRLPQRWFPRQSCNKQNL